MIRPLECQAFGIDPIRSLGTPGTVVFVRDPSLTRAATAAAPATTILSVGAKPGEPYQPMPWEDNQDAIHQQYFVVGRLSRDQVESYARRKGVPMEEVERWLSSNLAYDPAPAAVTSS